MKIGVSPLRVQQAGRGSSIFDLEVLQAGAKPAEKRPDHVLFRRNESTLPACYRLLAHVKSSKRAMLPRPSPGPRSRCWSSLVLLFPLLVCLGCPKSIGGVTATTIGSKGGTVSDSSCGLTLVIPAGALTSDTLFVVTESDAGAPVDPDRVVASVVCTVTPPTLFNTPANVTMVFDISRVPPDSTASDADLRLTEGGTSELRLPSNTVDVATSSVNASAPGTGGFYVTVPATPAPATINLTPSTPVALTVGQTQQYSAQVLDDTGAPAYVQAVIWSTGSAAIATVNDAGLLTAVGAGQTQIIATSTQGGGGDAGAISGSADVFVVSSIPSPSGFGWENPLPEGNDIHGLSLVDGALVVAANNGTVLVQLQDGGFSQLLSSPGLSLAGATAGGGLFGTAGTLDEVIQGIEHLSGVAITLAGSSASAQTFDTSVLSPVALYGDSEGVIAVGSGNDAYILESADAGWTPLDTPVSEALISVTADPTSGRRVVGARGQVYREQSDSWFPIWDQPLETLFSFATSVEHNAWATDEGLVLHQFVEGSGWSNDVMPSVPLDHLDMLSSLGGTLTLSAVDTSLVPHLWVRPASTWVDLPGLLPIDELYATASEPDGGGYVGGTNGALYSVSGGQLVDLRSGVVEDVDGLAVGSDGSAFATTAGACLNAACTEQTSHFLIRQTDGTWQAESAFVSTGQALRAVAAFSSANAIVVGDGPQAFQWDGTTLSNLNVMTTGNILAAQVCGNDVWIAGESGFLARLNGVIGFETASSGTTSSLYALACTSDSDIWAAGDYTLLHFEGVKWSSVSTPGVNAAPWRAVIADANEVWVAGSTDYLLHSPDRMTWEAVQDPAGLILHEAYGLWESSPGDSYLVGSTQSPRQGVILRWDGALWTPLDPGTDHEILSIAGVPASAGTRQIWIGGRDGSLLHSLP